MHICASLSRTRNLPEADKILTDDCANHGDQRKQQNKAGKYVVMKRFYNNKNLEIRLQSIKQIPTIHLKLTDETICFKRRPYVQSM